MLKSNNFNEKQETTGPTQYEIDYVEKLLEREKGHGQWDKHLIAIFLTVT